MISEYGEIYGFDRVNNVSLFLKFHYIINKNIIENLMSKSKIGKNDKILKNNVNNKIYII